MKVAIDFSVFAESRAFGNVTGEMDLEVTPQIGDTVSLVFCREGESIDPSTGFGGLLKVKNRILTTASAGASGVVLELEDIAVPTAADAKKLFEYFEKACGLFGNVYEDV